MFLHKWIISIILYYTNTTTRDYLLAEAEEYGFKD